jgi:anti-sigma regulatory factor (Ser/Thr protein kinase)
MFQGTPRQVAAVRSFVRSEFAGHAAIGDAVTAASELAANAITHTASGRDGGNFKVFLGVLSRPSVCLLVTDDGGPGTPAPRAAGADAESGRGLDIVTRISSVFLPIRQAGLTGVFVVITAEPGNGEPA